MCSWKSRKRVSRGLALAAGQVLVSAAAINADTITWTGDGDGSAWHDPNNWDLERVPDAGDDVVVPEVASTSAVLYSSSAGATTINSLTCEEALTLTGGTLTIESGAASSISNDLTLSGGTLGGTGDLTVTGLLAWTSGTMSGLGTTVANGGLELSGTITKVLQRNLENAGTATWTGTGQIWLDGEFKNLAGATFDAQNDAIIWYSSTPGRFSNQGTFRKSAGTQATDARVAFDNDGLVEVQAGTVILGSGGTSSGAFTGPGTAQFGGQGGGHVLGPDSSVTAAEVVFGSGTTDVHGTYDLLGTSTSVVGGMTTIHADATVDNVGALVISGGTVDFSSGDAVEVTSYTHSGGTLTGSDTVLVSGLLTWTGGTMSGSGTTIASGGIDFGGALTRILQRDFENSGTTTWTGTGQIWIDGEFTNLPGARFEAQTDTIMWYSSTPGTFINQGTFAKSSGTGTTTVIIPLHNDGTLDVQTGTIKLRSGGTSTGAFTGSGSLDFNGGTHTLESAASITATDVIVSSGTATFNPAATVSLAGQLTVSAGTVNFDTGGTIEVTTYTQSGGTVTGSDTVSVSGLLTWTGGTMSGSGTTVAGGGIDLSGAVTKVLQRSLENAGTATWTGTGQLWIDSEFKNLSGALFDVQNDTLMWYASSPGTFNNQGTLRKSAGTGTTDVRIAFDHSGILEVQTGTVFLRAGFPNFDGSTLSEGTYLIADTLKFTDANIVTNAATIVLDGPDAWIADQSNNDALANFTDNTVDGSFSIINGRNLTTPGAFANAGDLIAGSASTFSTTGDYTQSGGTTTLNGGTVSASGQVDIQAGLLRGVGTVDADLDNAGLVGPGFSPGIVSVTGDVEATGGMLSIEIGGLLPGDEFDVLAVDGGVTLTGSLDVSLTGGFEPAVGDSFDLLTATLAVGSFDTVNLPDLAEENCWELITLPTAVTLVVRAPASITDGPEGLEACQGDPVTFAVTVEGSDPLDLQWRLDGVDISGATGPSYTIDSVTLADAGLYDVVASNSCATVASDTATLTVHIPGAGDYDLDCDVDLLDYTAWPACMSGPGGGLAAGCAPFDFDQDNDVDTSDFAVLQEVFTGP